MERGSAKRDRLARFYRVVRYLQSHPEGATPEAVAGEIGRILADREYAGCIRQGLSTIREKMGDRGCSLRVARMASEMIRGVRMRRE